MVLFHSKHKRIMEAKQLIEKLEKLTGKKVKLQEESDLFPGVSLHPIVKQSIARAFKDLEVRYPALSDMNVSQNEPGSYKLHFTYGNRDLTARLNLTGDTYTKVMQDIARRIKPKKKTIGHFITR